MENNVDQQTVPTIAITLLGEEGTGKTAIQRYLRGKPFEANLAISNGANFKSIQLDKAGLTYKLRLCDISGNSSYEIIRRNYMKNSDGAIFVFDLTNGSSFAKAIDWLTEYLMMNENKNLPILIIGNKSDLENRQVSLKEVREFLQMLNQNPGIEAKIVGYIETSAKNGTNIHEGFQMLIDSLSTHLLQA